MSSRERFRQVGGWLEDTAGQRFLKFEQERTRILPYQRRVLELGGCPAVLPVRLLSLAETDWIYYEITGFIDLPSALLLRQKTDSSPADWLMRCALGVVEALRQAEDHLLPIESFSLTPETVFCRSAEPEVKLLFLPAQPNPGAGVDCLIALLEWLNRTAADDEFESYLGLALNTLRQEQLSLQGIGRVLNEFLRRMHQVDWPAATLERGHTDDRISGTRREKL